MIVQNLVDLVKFFLIPGSFWFLLLGLTIGVLIARGPKRLRRVAVPLLTALAVLYWVESLPLVSDGLARGLGAINWRPLDVADLADVQTIVVLGSGAYDAGGGTILVPADQTVLNVHEAARLFHLSKGQLTILASGGIADPSVSHEPETVVILELLRRDGVPLDHIILESSSRTTHEQAENVTQLLKAHHWDRFALVTSPVHLLRADRAFSAQGAHPIPAPAPFRLDGPDGPPPWWRPNGGALGRSATSLYDYAAWGYYWMRGWLTPLSART